MGNTPEQEGQEVISRERALGLREGAQDLRERQNRPLDSAQIAQRSAAMFVALYETGGREDGMLLAEAAESHSMAALGFDRVFRQTSDMHYLDEALKEGDLAIKAAEESHTETALPVQYHTIAKMYVEKAHQVHEDDQARLAAMRQAVDYFDKSIRYPLPQQHNYPLYKIELGAHLAAANLELDSLTSTPTKESEEWIQQVIGDFGNENEVQNINGRPVDKSYERAVWQSGLMIRYAQWMGQFSPDRKEQAQMLLAEAKKLVSLSGMVETPRLQAKQD